MSDAPKQQFVEVVAKAISQWMNGERLPQPPNWDRLQEATRRAYREQAETAIDACHAVEMLGALRLLVAAKDEKEQHGPTPHYESLKVEGWKAARALLAKLDGDGRKDELNKGGRGR